LTVVEFSADGGSWQDFIPRAYGTSLSSSNKELQEDLTRFLEDAYPEEAPSLAEDIILNKHGTLPDGLQLRLAQRHRRLPGRSCPLACDKAPKGDLMHWTGHDKLGSRLGRTLNHAGLVFPEHIAQAVADDTIRSLSHIGPASISRLEERLAELSNFYHLISGQVEEILRHLEATVASRDGVLLAAEEALRHFRSGITALRSIDDPPPK
jgi:hypothetical protein